MTIMSTTCSILTINVQNETHSLISHVSLSNSIEFMPNLRTGRARTAQLEVLRRRGLLPGVEVSSLDSVTSFRDPGTEEVALFLRIGLPP
jgi:hypothetical protein